MISTPRWLPFDYAVRNAGRAPMRLVLTLGGAALVVLLVLTAGAFVRGMEKSLRGTGGERNVMLLGAGSEESIERSEIKAGVAALVTASVPGIRTTLGVAHVSPEVHLALPVRAAADSTSAKLSYVRGFTPAALLVHENVQIVEGRLPRNGADEVMVGRLAARSIGVDDSRTAMGESLWIEGRPWRIVGRFAAPGTVLDAEVWAPLYDLKVATKRDTDSVVIAALGAAEFSHLDAFARQRLDLELVAMREQDYYGQLAAFYQPIRLIVWSTAVLIALGGLLAGLNNMYAAFAARVRELGMLQCLGYRRAAIVVSLMQESTLVALAGGLVAALAAIVFLDGIAVQFSSGAFGLSVDAAVTSWGLLTALGLGLIGALPPAARALAMPIPEALKAA